MSHAATIPLAGGWIEDAAGAVTPIVGTLMIGRSSKSTVRIESTSVSRRHALVHEQGGEFWLVDLGSTNGTLHRGRRVRQPVPLNDGDAIEISGQRFTFRRAASAFVTADGVRTTAGARRPPTTARVWLLLVDIEKSSSLSQQLSPEEFTMLVGRWFLACKDALEEHRAVINKYLGDGFLAYWPPAAGAPESVLATLRLLRAMQEGGPPAFRVVLHRGPVAVDADHGLGEESLLGAEVHFIFRMEKAAGAAGWPLTLSEAAARELAATRSLGEAELSGFPGRHRFYSL